MAAMLYWAAEILTSASCLTVPTCALFLQVSLWGADKLIFSEHRSYHVIPAPETSSVTHHPLQSWSPFPFVLFYKTKNDLSQNMREKGLNNCNTWVSSYEPIITLNAIPQSHLIPTKTLPYTYGSLPTLSMWKMSCRSWVMLLSPHSWQQKSRIWTHAGTGDDSELL